MQQQTKKHIGRTCSQHALSIGPARVERGQIATRAVVARQRDVDCQSVAEGLGAGFADLVAAHHVVTERQLGQRGIDLERLGQCRRTPVPDAIGVQVERRKPAVGAQCLREGRRTRRSDAVLTQMQCHETGLGLERLGQRARAFGAALIVGHGQVRQNAWSRTRAG